MPEFITSAKKLFVKNALLKKNKIYLMFREYFLLAEAKAYMLIVRFRWQFIKKNKPHGLKKNLFITLTSYPARFHSLKYTLQCLLNQSVKPDGVMLWISADDIKLLPEEVTDLCQHGLVIKECLDLKSYKKIIPALESYPDSILVTADDDLYYPRKWLEELVREYSEDKPEVICHRGREIKYDSLCQLEKYEEWNELKRPTNSSQYIFPTSGAGTLYPVGCFHSDVTLMELFSNLSPNADDLWLFWMHRLNDHNARKIGKSKRLIAWPGSQKETLKVKNLYAGGNDRQIESLTQHYGLPRK